MTFGAESRFGDVCNGFVQDGLEDRHGERKPVALQFGEDILRDVDDDVLARLLVGVVIERLFAMEHDVAHQCLLGCAIRRTHGARCQLCGRLNWLRRRGGGRRCGSRGWVVGRWLRMVR